jgi:hypothetical protein
MDKPGGDAGEAEPGVEWRRRAVGEEKSGGARIAHHRPEQRDAGEDQQRPKRAHEAVGRADPLDDEDEPDAGEERGAEKRGAAVDAPAHSHMPRMRAARSTRGPSRTGAAGGAATSGHAMRSKQRSREIGMKRVRPA